MNLVCSLLVSNYFVIFVLLETKICENHNYGVFTKSARDGNIFWAGPNRPMFHWI